MIAEIINFVVPIVAGLIAQRDEKYLRYIIGVAAAYVILYLAREL